MDYVLKTFSLWYFKKLTSGKNLVGNLISESSYRRRKSWTALPTFSRLTDLEIFILNSGVIVNNPLSNALSWSALRQSPFRGFTRLISSFVYSSDKARTVWWSTLTGVLFLIKQFWARYRHYFTAKSNHYGGNCVRPFPDDYTSGRKSSKNTAFVGNTQLNGYILTLG